MDRSDTRFNRPGRRYQNAIYWTIVPVVVVLLWTTTTVDWWTVVLIVGLGVAAVGQLGSRRSSDSEGAG